MAGKLVMTEQLPVAAGAMLHDKRQHLIEIHNMAFQETERMRLKRDGGKIPFNAYWGGKIKVIPFVNRNYFPFLR